MNAVRFIGFYDPMAEGKFLFEILSQLRNFGHNRIVTKSEWLKRWPDQASYIRVLQAAPKMDRWLRHSHVVGEWVLKGHALGIYKFERDLDRADWLLVHRHEEQSYIDATKDTPIQLMKPARIPLPPLQKHMLQMSGNRVRSDIPTKLCLDEEHQMYNVKLDDKLTPKTSIYDIDPEIYEQLYGKMMPVQLNCYGDVQTAKVDTVH